MKHRIQLFVALVIATLGITFVDLHATQKVEVFPIVSQQKIVYEFLDDSRGSSFIYNTQTRQFRFLSGQDQFIGWLENAPTMNCETARPNEGITHQQTFGANRGNFSITLAINTCFETGKIIISERGTQFTIVDTIPNQAPPVTPTPTPTPPVTVVTLLCAYSGTTGIKGWFLSVNEATGSFVLYRQTGKNKKGVFSFGSIYRGNASVKTKGDIKVITVEQTGGTDQFLRGVVKFNLANNTAIGTFFDEKGNYITINDRNIRNNSCAAMVSFYYTPRLNVSPTYSIQ